MLTVPPMMIDVPGFGGGLCNENSNPSTTLTLLNATIVGNLATNASSADGGIAYGGGIYNAGGKIALHNGLISGNTVFSALQQVEIGGGSVTIEDAIVEGGCPAGADCTNVTDQVIHFHDADGADNAYGTADDDLRLQATSPAVDNGDNSNCAADDIRGFSRPLDGNGDDSDSCDLGAYEYLASGKGIVALSLSGTGIHHFSPTDVIIEVVDDGGCLTGISVDQVDASHPSAPIDLQTGYYWTITPDGCTTGFMANLTLPTIFTSDANDKACRYSGGFWACAATQAGPNSVTLDGIVKLSDWTVGDDAAPSPNTTAALMTNALRILQILAGAHPSEPIHDFDENGKADLGDVIETLKYLANP
jgi:hypothetical protein